MEASIGLPTPKKPLRPSYKTMWLDICRVADALSADLETTQHDNDALGVKLFVCEASRYNWMRAAVIEGLALAMALVVLLAR